MTEHKALDSLMNLPPINSDSDIINATTQFARLAELPEAVGLRGDVETDAVRRLRVTLLAEEVGETLRGEQENDAVEVADGLADTIVIAWGTLLTYFGADAGAEILAEVWRSNLSKVDGSLGPIVRREDGKLLKPEGWTPPDIEGVLRRHGFLPSDPIPESSPAGIVVDVDPDSIRADDPDAPQGSSASQ